MELLYFFFFNLEEIYNMASNQALLHMLRKMIRILKCPTLKNTEILLSKLYKKRRMYKIEFVVRLNVVGFLHRYSSNG